VSERLLCVDDDPVARALIERIVTRAGYECRAAASVEEARVLLERESFAAVLCDVHLGGTSGLELLDELARTRPDLATVMVTGEDDPDVAETAIRLGAYGFVTKPFSASDLTIDIANALHRRRLERERREASASALQRAYAGTLRRLSRAVEYHDSATGAHQERVGAHAAAIATALGWSEAAVELLRVAAPLHDIGKIAIPDALLTKTGALTADERRIMERHTDVGRDLLGGSGSELLELAAVVAWTHHERWDGRGYPRRLAGTDIPLAGRIVAVADVFDALTSDRPYRAAFTPEEAIEMVRAESGAGFDPGIVSVFLHSLDPVPV
jgi:putative two-component system response regulator